MIKIDKNQFIDLLLKLGEDEYEKYCFIKDSLIYNKDFSIINLRCSICDKEYHENHYCEEIHVIPTAKNVIKIVLKDKTKCKEKRWKTDLTLQSKRRGRL